MLDTIIRRLVLASTTIIIIVTKLINNKFRSTKANRGGIFALRPLPRSRKRIWTGITPPTFVYGVAAAIRFVYVDNLSDHA